jgi:hypothetical protein
MHLQDCLFRIKSFVIGKSGIFLYFIVMCWRDCIFFILLYTLEVCILLIIWSWFIRTSCSCPSSMPSLSAPIHPSSHHKSIPQSSATACTYTSISDLWHTLLWQHNTRTWSENTLTWTFHTSFPKRSDITVTTSGTSSWLFGVCTGRMGCRVHICQLWFSRNVYWSTVRSCACATYV